MTNETKRLIGKKALVTGGSRGIGAAIVKRLRQEGASVDIEPIIQIDEFDSTQK